MENGSTGFRIQRKNGELRYVTSEWRFEFEDTGKPIRLFGIVQDITARRLAEIALEKSEEKYRKLFNVSPTPMWVFDPQTLQFLDVNQAAIKHYGYSNAEFMAMTLRDIWPLDKIKEFEVKTDALSEAIGSLSYTSQHIKKNGEVIDVDIQSNAIDLGGQAACLAIATDISERVKHLKAIEEQNVNLREIAWTQSHVVRAPLARLMGLINLLNDDPSEKTHSSEILTFLMASAHELDDIIKEIVRKAELIEQGTISAPSSGAARK